MNVEQRVKKTTEIMRLVAETLPVEFAHFQMIYQELSAEESLQQQIADARDNVMGWQESDEVALKGMRK